MPALFSNNILNTFIVSHSFFAVIFRSLTENQRNELGSSEKILELNTHINYFSDAVKVYFYWNWPWTSKYQAFFSLEINKYNRQFG